MVLNFEFMFNIVFVILGIFILFSLPIGIISMIRYHAKLNSFENYKLITRGMSKEAVQNLMGKTKIKHNTQFSTLYIIKGWSSFNTKTTQEITVSYDANNKVSNVSYNSSSTTQL